MVTLKQGGGGQSCAPATILCKLIIVLLRRKRKFPPSTCSQNQNVWVHENRGGEWVQPRGVMLTAPLHSPLLSRHSGALRVQILLAMSRMDLAKYALYL